MKILLFIALILPFVTASITYATLQQFFKLTYDKNNDQKVTKQELSSYFKLMQPDHQLSQNYMQHIHDGFDSNGDSYVTLRQLVQIAKLKITEKPGHKQIHLGFTANEAEMQVMWASTPERYNKPIVKYGLIPTQLHLTAEGTFATYNVGHLGFHGRIYRAIMKDLKPLQRYYYKVGDEQTQTFSAVKYFKSPPLKAQTLDEISIGIFGDMGTFVPMGFAVTKQIARDMLIRPLDFVFLTGDIAYAGISHENVGELQPVWDLFGQLTQSFAAYTAFMPGVGNHQRFYNYTSYHMRYVLPREYPRQTNLWFSFDYGQVHMVHFSSEHDYKLGSQQYDFLEEDLRKARSNPRIKWIILGVHRAFYSSDQTEYAVVTNLALHLEGLVNKYKVDLVQTGHLHDYERSWPTYKGKALKEGHNQTYFLNPKAPIYVVQGTAGALIRQKFITPSPQWSLKRMMKYGYGRIIIKGDELKYQYITVPSGRIVDEWRIVKTEQSQIQSDLQ